MARDEQPKDEQQVLPQPEAGPSTAAPLLSEHDEALLAVSPIDGRYRARTRSLAPYFSEFALIRYRVRIEIEWYLALAANPAVGGVRELTPEERAALREIYRKFALADARQVKELERKLNHDVKAVEYFVKERIAALGRDLPLEMVHFACTSEDINSLAYALALKEFVEGELRPELERVRGVLAAMAHRLRDVAMLGLTHGQPATPTTMGKELGIFAWRLERQLGLLARQEYLGKASGAVGNYNAHLAAYPEVDWIAHAHGFINSLGLGSNPMTTQIESHDYMAELFDTVVRIDTILLGLARDMWGYISRGCFHQRAVAGEVGSSTMPHKVNPIDFENCEGNLGVASALFQHLAVKLPVSRWQRDLSDSTALRNLGTAFGHLMVALAALRRGLARVEIDRDQLAAELQAPQAFEVLAEAIQTVMRRYGLPEPYEQLKQLTRGRAISPAVLEEFVTQLDLPQTAREQLRRLTPAGYLGLAAELVNRFVPRGSVE